MAKRRILVVDDPRVVHELARVALETIGGWEMLSADSGAAAVELAAVVVDVVMPDMDGPATVRALRDQAQTRDVAIVFLTVADDLAECARLAAMDVSGVLHKPFELSALAGEIAAPLDWAG